MFHGFASATAVNDVAEDTLYIDEGIDEPRLALYVGDWDPSGLCMSERDLPDRLSRYGGNVEIRRVALDSTDTSSNALPSFPLESKRADSRYRWFRASYGTRCWELDALSPVILRDRVEQAIFDQLDLPAWQRAERVEAVECASLVSILAEWKKAKAS